MEQIFNKYSTVNKINKAMQELLHETYMNFHEIFTA